MSLTPTVQHTPNMLIVLLKDAVLSPISGSYKHYTNEINDTKLLDTKLKVKELVRFFQI